MSQAQAPSTTTAVELFVGIDVAKNALDVHVLPCGQELHVNTNDDPHLESFTAALKALPGKIALVVMESTGGYQAPVAAALHEAGLPVVVVRANMVRSFANARGQLAKNDRIDARMIALFAERMRPPLRPMPDEGERALRELMARRRQLLGMIVQEKNRRDKAHTKDVIKSIEKTLLLLERQLAAIDKALDDAVGGSPLWVEREELLKTVPGVGPVVARTLLINMPELGTLTNKQTASLAGLAPVAADSGKRAGKRRVWGGRAAVRQALYMGTVSAVRCNAPIKAFYDRLVAAGKAKKLALIACARKLLTILNAMARTKKPWEPALT